jgi:hypothetical protein
MKFLKALLKDIVKALREKPRYIFLISGLAVQVLEKYGVGVDAGLMEEVLDIVTLIILGHVMKKSESGKYI